MSDEVNHASSESRSSVKSRLLPAAVAVVIVGLAVGLYVQVLDHAKDPVYLIPKQAEVILLIAVTAILASAVLSVTLVRGWVIFLVGAGVLTIFLGILLTLLGIPFLAIGVGLLFLAYRLAAGVQWKQRLTIFTSGAITALSMALLFMAWSQPPLVDCSENGVSVTPSYWFWGGGPSSTRGSAHTTRGGETRGEETFDGKTYSYVCRNGELVDFRISEINARTYSMIRLIGPSGARKSTGSPTDSWMRQMDRHLRPDQPSRTL